MSNILELRNVSTSFYIPDEGTTLRALKNVSMSVRNGSITAIVGESGSGKSVACRSIFGLIDPPGEVETGEILFKGTDLLKLSEKQRKKIFGNEMFMIFQDCSSSLNPVYKVKTQMLELLRLHNKYSGKENAKKLCLEALRSAHLSDAERVYESYPFELSGGMCQRVMIAMALLVRPALLVADEPTTALDLTIQAGILDELKKLREQGISILLITHDIGVVAQMADYVYVMEDGCVVEEGDVFSIFDSPQHHYTKLLLEVANK